MNSEIYVSLLHGKRWSLKIASGRVSVLGVGAIEFDSDSRRAEDSGEQWAATLSGPQGGPQPRR